MSRSESRRLHLGREVVRELSQLDLKNAGAIQWTPQTGTSCYPTTQTLVELSICECPTGITNASCYKTCTC